MPEVDFEYFFAPHWSLGIDYEAREEVRPHRHDANSGQCRFRNGVVEADNQVLPDTSV
jgi:hypothetical protein